MSEEEGAEPPDMTDLLGELRELEDIVDDPDEREQVRETIDMVHDLSPAGVFGRIVRGYDRADIAEAVLGSLLFGIPMAVESGTQEVGAALAASPAAFALTLFGSVAMVYGIIYVADIQEVRVVDPLFGVIPRRLVGAVLIPFTISVVLLTAWGRVDWVEPTVALGQVVAAFAAMALGAALTDIVPGS